MGNFEFIPLSLAYVAGALALFVALVMVSLRERGSEGITEFNSMIVLVIVWLMAQAVINAIGTPDDFLLAAKLQFVILIFVVVSLYDLYRRFGAARVDSLRFINQLLLVGFAAGIVLSDAFIVGVRPFRWGLEPIFDWPMLFPIAWMLLMAAMTASRMFKLLRKEPRDTQERQRISLLFWALGVFVFGFCIEVLADVGFAMPPLSWLFVPLSMGLITAAVWRHGMAVINRYTPLFQVLKQFQGGLVLLDKDGIVRVYNPRALELLGKTKHEVLRKSFLSLVECDATASDLASRFDARQDPETRIVTVAAGRYAKRELRVVCSQVFEGQMRGLACRIQDLSHEQRERDYAITRELLTPDTELPTLKVLEAGLARRDIDERLPAVGVLRVSQIERSALLHSHGHTAASTMDKHVADLLSDLQSRHATMYALPRGGFAFLLREDGASVEQSLARLEARINEALQKPLLLATEQLPVRHAQGHWQQEQGKPDAVDSFARWLRTQQFAANRDQASAASAITAEDIQQALDSRQFLPLYAPIVDLRSGRATGLQPYITWDHPTLGHLSMGGFAHLLTQAGLYVDVHNAVLQLALADLRGFQQVLGDQSMTLNIRPHSEALATYISESGAEMVLNALGDMARHIVMTLTPSFPLDGVLISAMHRLRDEGMQLEMREFGLGNPSLAHVVRLPLSGVRITRELYAASGDPYAQGRAVAAVVAAASSMGLYCSADEVETVEQMRLLSSAGCQFATGPLFGEPLDSEMILATLLSPGLLEFVK